MGNQNNGKKKIEAIVVGAGASGLVCAIRLKEQGVSVLILEKENKIGKKILATGNGKCNLSNLVYEEDSYRGSEPSFVQSILKQVGVEDTVSFFQRLGMEITEEKGYLYPNTKQAATVVDTLMKHCEALNIPMIKETKVENIVKKGERFFLSTKDETYAATYVVLACGGCASSKLGSDGSGYGLAKKLNHTICTPTPALVGLHSDDKCFKELAGIRIKADLSLKISGKIYKQYGELQLTNYGVSGVPIFQLSRYATKAFLEKKKVTLEINFLPHYSKEALELFFKNTKENVPYKTVLEVLEGVLNKKLASVLVKKVGDANLKNLKITKLSKNQKEALIKQIRSFQTNLVGSNDFEQAQVTAGGVYTNEVKETTLESKRQKNLYFVGEILDIDGTCGGYNLQWAWSTGICAANHIAKTKERIKK